MTADAQRTLAPLQPADPATVGPFTLLGRLGEGGMGIVFLGRDTAGTLAAVKTVRREYAADEGYRARFTTEVALARRVLGHCIAPVLDADPHGEHPWLATAYVPGPTLREYLATRGTLRGSDLYALAAGLAEALAAIHRENVVHRDLKPDNVVITDHGPRVLDFGIAQALDEASITHMDMVVGTPGWISPERYCGERAGPASDMFCWGGLVAFSASGRPPYGIGAMEQLRYRTLHGEPDAAGDVLPENLRPIVARALCSAPEERPDAREAFHALTGQDPEAGTGHLTHAVSGVLARDWTVTVSDTGQFVPLAPLRTVTAAKPLTFLGHTVHDPAALAALLHEHPQRAEQWLCGPGAQWLRAWLDDINDTRFDRHYLTAVDGPAAAALALTAFAVTFRPEHIPTYRGCEVHAAGFRRLAQGTPQDRRLLSEALYADVALIAAAHHCGHQECESRCSRLDRVGRQAPAAARAALTLAGELGVQPGADAEERAAAHAVLVTLDAQQPPRAPTALVHPWWRWLRRRLRAADTGTDAGLGFLTAAHLLAPSARDTAPAAWRSLLRPRTWIGPGWVRTTLAALMLWVVLGLMLGALLAAALPDAAHPDHPGALTGSLAFQLGLWPLYALYALLMPLLPRRCRGQGYLAATVLCFAATVSAPALPPLPVQVPGVLGERLMEGLAAVGGYAPLLVLGLVVLGFVALGLLVGGLGPLTAAPGPRRPLLTGRGMALPRFAVAAVGLSLALGGIWWGMATLLLVASGYTGDAPDTTGTYALLAGVVLPACVGIAVISVLLWHLSGPHPLWLLSGVLLVVAAPLHESGLGADLPGLASMLEVPLHGLGAAAGWVALMGAVPGGFALAAWITHGLAYRRARRPAPPGAPWLPSAPPPPAYTAPLPPAPAPAPTPTVVDPEATAQHARRPLPPDAHRSR